MVVLGFLNGVCCGGDMSFLSRTEEELILDYGLGRLAPARAQQAEALVARDDRAAEACQTITAALVPLTRAASNCPDELVERAVVRLCAAAQVGALASPLPETIRSRQRWNLRQVATLVTVAACLVLILSTAIPSLNLMRHRHYRRVCLGQLGRIFASIELYSSDHERMLPAVARADGLPWHNIGSQGPSGYSNARNLFLLLKLGYNRKPMDFICCGGTKRRTTSLEPSLLSARDDFVSRENITYSYRLIANLRTKLFSLASKPLMADMNPHFETLSVDMNVCPDAKSLHLNSVNHDRQGQNVLYGDGHAFFNARRFIGDGADDIYTIENTPAYHGFEWPVRPDDTFVAP